MTNIEPPQPPKLLDRVRLASRVRHYSIRTEEAYVNWIRRYIVHHGKKHPSAMGAPEINAFLSYLASDLKRRRVDSEPATERDSLPLSRRPRGERPF